MTTRSIRNRLVDNTNLWPGFVDVLATLLIVIIFVLMIFTVSQIYLSDALSGRDKILSDLKKQINELSKVLIIETKEKDEAISSLLTTKEVLSQTEEELQSKQLLSEQLQTDVSKKRSEIFVQEQNILALSEQITELLTELRIVANALKTYEGVEVSIIETEGLGQRINKALATRVDQLKELNNELELTNKKLQTSEENLASKVFELNNLNNKLIINEKELENKINQLDEKNKNLQAINESLGLDDASLVEQLQAISNKNDNLLRLNDEILKSKKEIEAINVNLTLRDKELQDQILKYKNLTTNLLELNESLGLQDADIQQQLAAIRKKNKELSDLNKGLLDKDKTIFDLRGKILELNNILSINQDKEFEQTATISNLKKKLSDLTTLSEIDKDIVNNIKIVSINNAKSILEYSLIKPIAPLHLSESDIIKSQKSNISSVNIDKSSTH